MMAGGATCSLGMVGGSGSCDVRMDLMYATSFQICSSGILLPQEGMPSPRPAAIES